MPRSLTAYDGLIDQICSLGQYRIRLRGGVTPYQPSERSSPSNIQFVIGVKKRDGALVKASPFHHGAFGCISPQIFQ